MWNRLLAFGTAFIIFAILTTDQHGLWVETANRSTGIEQLLDRVPEGSAWQDLSPGLQAGFEKRASSILAQDRQAWGLSGLSQKEEILFSAPTPAMIGNIDRVISAHYSAERPSGFRMARDVRNADIKRNLLRVYLADTDNRSYMLYDHPDFKGWDGKSVKELQLVDHEHVRDLAIWHRQTEENLKKIADDKLNPLEKALREKTYYDTRAEKYFDRPALATGISSYAGLYALDAKMRPFQNDTALLDAYNASMFSQFRDVNIGTVDAFNYEHQSEFNAQRLKKLGMPDQLIKNILKLGHLFLTRVQGLSEASRRCTIFSPSERRENWDSFTAGQLSNSDGSETLEAYARLFEGIAAKRLDAIRVLSRNTLERLFPDGSPDLSAEQREQVSARLMQEKQPAKVLNTLLSALNQVTGSGAASTKVRDAMARLPSVGGGYAPGQPVRDTDRKLIFEMWSKLRSFLKREYAGYQIDIGLLIPEQPIIVTTGQNQFTLGGDVTLSLATAWNLPSLSSTMMHEMKHAIDQNLNNGSNWEGAAVSVERQVWPVFIQEAMAFEPDLLPIAILITEIDNVRFTATTDATLQIFLRDHCEPDEPDTIAYAEGIVRGYGFDDAEILRLRSRRAHSSMQYLEYDYGLAVYTQLLSFLQDAIGPVPRVDAFLLQACGLPDADRSQATIDSLKACIRKRIHYTKGLFV